MNIIEVDHLVKNFKTYKKDPGFWGSVKSLVNRKYFSVPAVSNVSFSITEGELVGFIGPNGAGKTTTLKCLSGLIYPTSGNVSVLGYEPFQRKNNFLRQISLVMGQKNQLWWDLPAMETFLLNKEIYEIKNKEFHERVEEFSKLLDVKESLNIPVRKLSLGQRMKCELIAALLHGPKVLFLDEPTIGLDVVMQQKLRDFIKKYNEKHKTTIILTSHYMQDVKELCERVIIIDHGTILYDGKLEQIVKKYARDKLVTVIFEKKVEKKVIERFGKVREYEPQKVLLSVPVKASKNVVGKILEEFDVEDITIEEIAIEDIVADIFKRKPVL